MSAPRVTEQSNPVTRRLGTFSRGPVLSSEDAHVNFQFGDGCESGQPLDALGVLRVLSSCDSQLFTGSDGLPSMHCDGPITASARCAQAISTALRSGGAIVFAGCGTSGRLAHLLSGVYNKWWRTISNRPKDSIESPFDYCLAGGDAALLVPAESVEDSPEAGAFDLVNRIDALKISSDSPLVVIGISCGLSAMYVAGVLGFALTRPGAFTVALGFNALSAVASVSVPGAGPRFFDVLETLDSNPSVGAVVNPVVGAEAVAGSSRMKGGSASLILCAAMVEVGAKMAFQVDDNDATNQPLSTIIAQLRSCFVQAEVAVRSLYSEASPLLANVLNSAADSLCTSTINKPQIECSSKRYITPSTSGRIFYLGSDAAGLLGLIDASEATDTYGSKFNDVRAFTIGGWDRMSVRPGMIDPVIPLELRGTSSGPSNADNSASQIEYANPNLTSFIEDFVPSLTTSDCVIALWIESSSPGRGKDSALLLEALTKSANAGAAVHAIIIGQNNTEIQFSTSVRSLDQKVDIVEIKLPSLSMATTLNKNIVDDKTVNNVPVLALLALKLSLNALTTGAHVSKGVIIGNVMGNMMLTNHKLFLRAIGIVASLARCSAGEARYAILRSIYNVDKSTDIDALVAAEEKDANMVHQHVARAAITPRVIPSALLLAAPKPQGLRATLVSDVRKALATERRVGRALSILYSILAEKKEG